MYIKVLGKRWDLRFVSRLSKAVGQCDHPEEPQKQIRILKGLPEKECLEVVIHEVAHAACWHADEEFIDEAARDLAEILWKLGWRNPNVS